MNTDRLKFRVWYDKEMLYFPHRVLSFDGYLKEALKYNDTIMQCTGLKDKNGKLIYEGDIIDDLKSDSFHDKEFNMSFAGCSSYKKGTGKKVVYKVIYSCGSFLLDPFEKGSEVSALIGFEEFPKAFHDYDTIHDKFCKPYTKLNIEIIGNIYENPELSKFI